MLTDQSLMRFCVVSFALSFLFATSALASSPPSVTEFSPKGTAVEVSQMRLTFSTPMVPLGAADSPAPVDGSCNLAGAGRWIDTNRWVYDFAKPLPGGLRCEIRMRDGLVDLAGVPLKGERRFSFDTGGPTVSHLFPSGGVIEENPLFAVRFNVAPGESFLAHSWCDVEGIEEKIPLRLVTGDEREWVIQREGGDTFLKEYAIAKDDLLTFACSRPLPNDREVRLVFDAGLVSRSGVATTSRQVHSFTTRPAFTVTFSCDRESPSSGCDPMGSFRLLFSDEVFYEDAGKIALVARDGTRRLPDYAGAPDDHLVSSVTFDSPFDVSSGYTILLPNGFVDATGRPPVNEASFPLKASTGRPSSLIKIGGDFGVIERSVGLLPVTVRNVEPTVAARITPVGGAITPTVNAQGGRYTRDEEIIDALRLAASTPADRPFATGKEQVNYPLPDPGALGRAQVIGLPVTLPGLYLVEVKSAILGSKLIEAATPYYAHTAALVTNMAVHLKWGRERSAVWVTSLANGRPEEGVAVTLRDCKGAVHGKGVTGADGIALMPGIQYDTLPSCDGWSATSDDMGDEHRLGGLGYGLFAFAAKGDDLSFVHSSWSEGIEGWRFDLPEYRWANAGVVSHAVMDRTLFRAGETAHGSLIVRRRVMDGFLALKPDELPDRVTVRLMGGEDEYHLPLVWRHPATFAPFEWAIPDGVKKGEYAVTVSRKGVADAHPFRYPVEVATVRVEEFVVPLMKGTISFPVRPLVRPASLPVDLSLAYLAGGGAVGEEVATRVRYVEQAPPIQGYDDTYQFGSAPLTLGVQNEAADVAGEGARQKTVLDKDGNARVTFDAPTQKGEVMAALVEMDYRDPNGLIRTVRSTSYLYPSSLLVGMKVTPPYAARQKRKVTVATVTAGGATAPGRKVTVNAYRNETFVHRKKSVGGSYTYEETRRISLVGEACHGVTGDDGLFTCILPAPEPGDYFLQAEAVDDRGDASYARCELWEAGRRQWWRVDNDSDRIDVVADRKRYQPGETARIEAHVPFKEATALVTVEREGVIDAWVVPMKGDDPVIEVPIRKEYAPNVYISVLAVRGRVATPAPTGMIDLAKPAFKLGVVGVDVGGDANRLDVAVTSDKTTYKTRETATVDISLAPVAAGASVAVAVVDEGLLALKPNDTWELFESMMGRRPWETDTATAAMQVVGKRHFGMKARAAGGGGGKEGAVRELFDTLLYWNGALTLDAEGKGRVTFPLNDAISSFKVVVVAVAGTGRFGTGSTTFTTDRPLTLFAGLPEVVREGDRYRPRFTLRNGGGRARNVVVTASIKGKVAQPVLPPRRLLLPAGGSATGEWEVTVPGGSGSLVWEIVATADNGDEDRLKKEQRVEPVTPVTVTASVLRRIEKETTLPIAAPAGAQPGRGGVDVTLTSRFPATLDAVNDYFTAYPHRCLEQQVAIAVGRDDLKEWKRIAATLPQYLDDTGLAAYYPKGEGSVPLTAAIVSILREARFAIPAPYEKRMLDALTNFVEGRLAERSRPFAADGGLRKMAALAALARAGRSLPHGADTVGDDQLHWPTSMLVDWLVYLDRTPKLPHREERIATAEAILANRLYRTGTTLGLADAYADSFPWLMVSPDTTSLKMALALLGRPAWKDDAPLLMAHATGRQVRGVWDQTTANAWGALLIRSFKERSADDEVAGTTRLSLAGASRSHAWIKGDADANVTFPLPGASAPLVFDHDGTGAPWGTITTRGAIPSTVPRFHGVSVTKQVEPVGRVADGRFNVGDIVRVTLSFTLSADNVWLALTDPIPVGGTILGNGLGGDRAVEDGATGEWADRTEQSFTAMKAYYTYAPKGTYTFSYLLRLNTAGTYQLPPTVVEAMYAPAIRGLLPHEPFVVR